MFEILITVGIVILWLASGFYGMITWFRTKFDIDMLDLIVCILGSISGPLALLVGLVEKYKSNKVFFKKFD